MDENIPEPPRASTEVIRNCRFAFRCAQQWETLSAGAHPRQRYCGECERHVVLCESDDELRTALRRNDCVAIPANLLTFKTESDEAIPYMVGQLTPEYGYRAGHAVPTFRLVDGDEHADSSGA
jgi:hypothetical protein